MGPETYTENWLLQQIDSTLAFYYPTCIDEENGGYHHSFYDNGELRSDTTKHLVGTSRFIYNFSIGAILGRGDFAKKLPNMACAFYRNITKIRCMVVISGHWMARK